MADGSTGLSRKTRSGRVVNSASEKAQEVLKEDYGKARTVAFDALKSQAYLYPIKGIFYFLTHHSLWKPFLSRLGPYVILSVSVIGGMFAVTYLPQLAVLVLVNGPFAVVSTVLIVLNESSTIINIVSRNWILQDALLDTFDGTLVSRNRAGIVSEGREIKSGSDPMQRLGRVLKSPFERFGPKALVPYLVYLPLNFIPVVGTVMFIFFQGRNRGKLVHGRYFQLKKWSSSQRSAWLEKHTGPYTAFGLVATLLEMVPLASMFFTYTNTVGAALWAADIEALDTSMTDETAPTLKEAAKKVE
ncbi:Outer spore wall protein RRT8 [Tolypocladium ophioglossoides CBS 100239]|uniref:Outer spore wall protein RRT8 n=1 Tax=Tolypocladium ophioglossoides (strain CBS 100239) TaxID=1163406 RepID=A0A0L0MZX4_TOLOC|nr:Outer spore wall protein RRT8 [Tolypocladium ophioglossoides CBS 100239]